MEMKMRYILFGLLIIPSIVFAQDLGLDDALSDLAKDLAQIQREVDNFYIPGGTSAYSEIMKRGFEAVTVTKPNAPAYSGAASTTELIKRFSGGENFIVLDKVDDWYAVDLVERKKGPSGKILLDEILNRSAVKGTKTGSPQSGWINATDVTLLPVGFSSVITDLFESANDAILRKVHALMQKYNDHPYFRVTGFSIILTIPPAVSFDFEIIDR